jgi:hypothetical protein
MTRQASLAAALLALAACRHGDPSAQHATPSSRSAPVASAPGRGHAGSDRDAAPAGNAPAASDADRRDGVAGHAGGAEAARGERAPSRDAQAAGPRSRFEVRGTVASTGGGLFGGNKLTIDRAGAPPAELRVGDDTRITIGGQPAKLSDLAEGDEVRATFDMDGDRAVATSIRAEHRPPRAK